MTWPVTVSIQTGCQEERSADWKNSFLEAGWTCWFQERRNDARENPEDKNTVLAHCNIRCLSKDKEQSIK